MKYVIAFALVFVIGCGGTSVVGKWDAELSGDDPALTARLAELGEHRQAVEFEKNGTATFAIGGQTIQGTYDVEGSTLTFTGSTPEGGTKASTFTVGGDGETISGSLGKIKLSLTRSE